MEEIVRQSNSYIYDSPQFLRRLVEEKRRSERAGQRLCMYLIDLVSLYQLYQRENGSMQSTYDEFFGLITDVMAACTRQSDIKGWYNKDTLGIIMPDTEKSEAEFVKKSLAVQIKKEVNGAMPANEIYHAFEICSYPSETVNHKEKAERRVRVPMQMACSILSYEQLSPGFLTGDACTLSLPFYTDLFEQIDAQKWQFKLKRLLDIVCASLGLLLAFPIMLLIAIGIKVTSEGPALFRQQRLGFLGKKFTFLKFRTMYVNSDAEIHKKYTASLINGNNEATNRGSKDKPLYKIDNDPRVTSLGRFLRKTSLDELPQLFNVLKGDMSLVGPRPCIPYEVEHYQAWHLRRVLEVKPGITGLWQVSGRSCTTFDTMVRLDLEYAATWNLWFDVKILFKTIGAVLSTRGGY